MKRIGRRSDCKNQLFFIKKKKGKEWMRIWR